MSNDKRHDYSLLGSFMPKEETGRPASIPVELDLGDASKKKHDAENAAQKKDTNPSAEK